MNNNKCIYNIKRKCQNANEKDQTNIKEFITTYCSMCLKAEQIKIRKKFVKYPKTSVTL